MKLFNLKKKGSKSGFSLIELLLVVGFIALVSLGVYTVYNKVNSSNAANEEARVLDTLRAGIKNLYGSSSSYNGVGPAVVNNARITPDNMRAIPYVVGDTQITNKFGGAVGIAATTLTVADSGFRITYPNVPGDICTKLVSTAGRSFDQVTIGTTVVKAFGTNNLIVPTVAATCAAAPAAGITILFDSL